MIGKQWWQVDFDKAGQKYWNNNPGARDNPQNNYVENNSSVGNGSPSPTADPFKARSVSSSTMTGVLTNPQLWHEALARHTAGEEDTSKAIALGVK